MELVRLGLGGAGHAGELEVKAEVILDRDRRKRLRLAVDLHAFLRLDGLMQTVAPAAARHFAAGEFIDDDDLVVLDDVLHVLFKKAVGAEQLRDVVDALGLMVASSPGDLAFTRSLAGFVQRRVVVDVGKLRHQIRQHERVRVVGIQKRAALFAEIGLVRALVDGEEQLLL